MYKSRIHCLPLSFSLCLIMKSFIVKRFILHRCRLCLSAFLEMFLRLTLSYCGFLPFTIKICENHWLRYLCQYMRDKGQWGRCWVCRVETVMVLTGQWQEMETAVRLVSSDLIFNVMHLCVLLLTKQTKKKQWYCK